jgi:hypothetical protein
MNDLEKQINDKFTDQWWVSTQGYNDKRNEAIKSVCEQRESAAKKEGAKEVIEAIPDDLQVRTIVGGDEPDIEYQNLKQQLRDKWL